jgi:hypothetical protein
LVLGLFSASGGLVYHARALRYRNGLWAPFRAALAGWLERCLPPGDELILVGPSGGHCLPLELLARHRRLVALEPDPLARFVLQTRLAPAQLELEHRDLLLHPLLSGARGLDALLERRPHAAVLFCNLLGQLQIDLADEQQERFQSEFRRRVLPLLAARSWASFHDRWSLDREQHATPSPPETLSFERVPSDDELAVAYFGTAGAPVTAFDHGASALFPEAWPRRYFSWQLTPHALHVVEGVSGGPTADSGFTTSGCQSAAG